MATKVYVLIETTVGKAPAVTDELRKLSGVDTVDGVTGPYDIIAVVNVPDLNSVGDLITSKIHTINGILRTVTCLAISAT